MNEKGTRSRTDLPGDIRQYLLENTAEEITMPGTSGTGSEDQTAADFATLVAGVGGDANNLYALLAKSLSIANESNKQLQERVNQNSTSSMKLESCPTKRKCCTLDAWIEEVKLWDESNNLDGASGNAKKYLKFVDSVRTSEECEDLKSLVQQEFVENKDFDKKTDDVIKQMVKKIGEKLSNTDLEKSTEAWVEFMNIKQGDDEDAKAYVTRFEQAETKLRNVKIKVPNKALAIHLMNKSNLEEQSKENVLTKVELDDETKLYSSMMKSIREMKCNLTKNKEKTVSDKDENRTYYGNRNNYDYHTRARSKSKFNDRSGRQRSKSWSKFRDNRERRDDRENRDTRERRDDRGNRDFQGRRDDRGRRSCIGFVDHFVCIYLPVLNSAAYDSRYLYRVAEQ